MWAISSSCILAIVVECCAPVEGPSLPREVVLSLPTHPPHREFLLTTPFSYGNLASHPRLLFWRRSAGHNQQRPLGCCASPCNVTNWNSSVVHPSQHPG